MTKWKMSKWKTSRVGVNGRGVYQNGQNPPFYSRVIHCRCCDALAGRVDVYYWCGEYRWSFTFDGKTIEKAGRRTILSAQQAATHSAKEFLAEREETTKVLFDEKEEN